LPDEFDSHRQLLHDQLGLQAQHAIPEALELGIPAGISGATPPMHRAVNLHYQADLRGEEVHYEATTQNDLTTELDAELPGIDSEPQPGFAGGQLRSHDGGVELNA
jgi:hypothetical protein